jgi:hypothetical protein
MKFSGRRRLATEMSSSIASQWMPMPPPISSQSDRSRRDASTSRGNHTRGTETTRPSDSVTDSASLEHDTSTASASALSTKVLMPFLQEELPLFYNDLPDRSHLMPTKTPHVSHRYWLQPKLRIASTVSDVDVRRLAPLHTEEEEPIPTNPQQSGHYSVYRSALAVQRLGRFIDQPVFGLGGWLHHLVGLSRL